MIYIDLPADLNLEDDEGRNIARLADAVTPDTVTQGAVLVTGTRHARSWAVIEDVESGFVYFPPDERPGRRAARSFDKAVSAIGLTIRPVSNWAPRHSAPKSMQHRGTVPSPRE